VELLLFEFYGINGWLFFIEANKHSSEQCVDWAYSSALPQFSHFGFSIDHYEKIAVNIGDL